MGTPLIVGLAILVSMVAIAGILNGVPASNTALPVASSSPTAGSSSDAFRAGFRPLLAQAAADASILLSMGESRERNLLRIRAGQEAMSNSLAAADAWLGANPPSAADEPAIAAYRDGAAATRTAMEEAQAGFLRFDFDRVGRATETMRQGAAALEHAIALLAH